MALFNNNLSYSPPQVDPSQKKQAVYDYLMKKRDTGFIPAQGSEGLKQKLSVNAEGDQIAVTPIEARLSDMAMNPNRQTSITDALNYSRTAPSIEKKSDVNAVTPQEKKEIVKNYIQNKREPKQEETKPSEAKKQDDSNLDWSYAFQGLASLGGAISAGSGGQANQGQLASTFQGMRDARDQREEQARLNDPSNEKAVEFRDFLKNNFNPKLLKDVDLGKMSLGDMQNMYGQLKDREGADLQRQMMMAKAGSRGSVKNNPNSLKDINEHVASLRDLSSQRQNIIDLNRNPLGSWIPDTDSKTIAKASEIDKLAQSGVKAIAGPGTITDSERKAFLPLLPNSSERSGSALAKSQESIKTAIEKGRKYINDQYMTGAIDEDTARYYLNQYAQEEVNSGLYDPKKGKK
ncbi:hypothetical protein EHR02_00145 [Leptospira levettii]|uniref:hypothetical protein n=1 Tax=Leptospira levettii TaxID=2023178 RepID=UPI0010831EE4|nr:hypothetical protein [Leptospira levettii]TGM95048.1 hypothetical protein EHR02_00145 [Leptospira levettii]